MGEALPPSSLGRNPADLPALGGSGICLWGRLLLCYRRHHTEQSLTQCSGSRPERSQRSHFTLRCCVLRVQMLKALCTVGKGSWAGRRTTQNPWKQPARQPSEARAAPGLAGRALRGPAAQPSSLRPLPRPAAFRKLPGRSLIHTLHATFLRDGFPENPIAALNERFP